MKKLFKLAIVAAVVKVGYDRVVKRNLKKAKEESETIDDIPKSTRSWVEPWGEAPKSP